MHRLTSVKPSNLTESLCLSGQLTGSSSVKRLLQEETLLRYY